MFLWVLMRICVSVYFLKKSQPKDIKSNARDGGHYIVN
jgi:hypothetical protein